MNSRSRTLSGAALMLLIIPIFAGLLACMPVPIGDPERSRIDRDLTGIWVASESDSGSGAAFYIFEPYDKRTWLITGIAIQEGDLVDIDNYDFSTYEGYEDLARNEEVSSENFYSDGVVLYKAWLTKLAGEQFLTWEPKGKIDALAEDPEFWIVFHVTKEDDRTMILRMVDGEAEPFEGIDKTRRAYERVLKKHVKDPEIYGESVENFRLTLVRAEGPVLSFLEDIADFVIEE